MESAGEERKRELRMLEKRLLENEAKRVRAKVLTRFSKENKKDRYLDNLDMEDEEYYQIINEYDLIFDLISRNFLKIIKSKIKEERNNNSNPPVYLPKIQNEMIIKENKIRNFFTFEKYLNRRIHNLEKDYLEYIKNHAYQNEAYEFLDVTKEIKED